MVWGEAAQKKRFASRFEGQFDKGKISEGVEVYTEASSWAEYKGQFKDDKWHNEGKCGKWRNAGRDAALQKKTTRFSSVRCLGFRLFL